VTLRRIEDSLSVFKAGNEDIERTARANLQGLPRHGGLHGVLGCWWLERVVDLARHGRVGATVGLATIGPAEGIALAATGGADGSRGSGCWRGEGWGLWQRSSRWLVCGGGRGVTQVPELEHMAVRWVVALDKED
jgi:hypothetical protein